MENEAELQGGGRNRILRADGRRPCYWIAKPIENVGTQAEGTKDRREHCRFDKYCF